MHNNIEGSGQGVCKCEWQPKEDSLVVEALESEREMPPSNIENHSIGLMACTHFYLTASQEVRIGSVFDSDLLCKSLWLRRGRK